MRDQLYDLATSKVTIFTAQRNTASPEEVLELNHGLSHLAITEAMSKAKATRGWRWDDYNAIANRLVSQKLKNVHLSLY